MCDNTFSDIPDILCIFVNCTVSGEDACICDVVQGHLGPGILVGVQLGTALLYLAVAVEVSQNHVRILGAQGVSHFGELAAVDAGIHPVDTALDDRVVVVIVLRTIATSLEGVDFLGLHAEDEDVVSAHCVADLDVCAVQCTQCDRTVQHQLHVVCEDLLELYQ